VRLRTCVVAGVLRGLRHLDSQPPPRTDHVEACRPQGLCTAVHSRPSTRAAPARSSVRDGVPALAADATPEQALPTRDLAVHAPAGQTASAVALACLGVRTRSVEQDQVSWPAAQGSEQRDRAAERPQCPPRVNHDRPAPPHGGQDARVMAHIRGAPAFPTLVVGVDDPHDRGVDGPADERRLTGSGKAGNDHYCVLWIGQAHENQSAPAGSAGHIAALSTG